ncbi:methyltransferase family protein [Roseiarcus fermentans]|uniref:Methyltransferase family protein n=1 Tax=Roseiarcus fermentans TaxID=1473586 RepID=A0A366F7E3_9HYPH|nr:methyltransferase domain-containing protein [Roseiarcus fermentans]RBP10563.1 methyltransferase family protein [Roseiarcus fermentans]
MPIDYVHGYDDLEARRLQDQAGALTDLLHSDTRYAPGEEILEVGCGVGAQTVTLLRNSPKARFTCIDRSAASLEQARSAVERAGFADVRFLVADVFALPFPPASFNHVFLCFVLEHLSAPASALREIRTVLRPGGTLTVIEGDHGTACFHPDSSYARRAIACQVELQARAGGDAMIGRRLFPLLADAGFADVRVSPRLVYVDGSRPQLIDSFTRKTFTSMIEGVREAAVTSGLATADDFDRGAADLRRTASPDAVFCYTFFKAFARAD